MSVLPQGAPDLARSLPGPFPVSPHASRLRDDLHRWLEGADLLPSPAHGPLSTITGHGIAHAFPHAEWERSAAVARLFAWLAAFDDTCEADLQGAERRVAECLPVLAGAAAGPAPYPQALRTVLDELARAASPAECDRMTRAIERTLTAILWETSHVRDLEPVSIDTYRSMRPHTALVSTLIAAVEPISGCRITDTHRASAPVADLHDAVGDLGGLINDWASYRKEKKAAHPDSPEPLSLPGLLVHHQGLTPEEALSAVAQACTRQAEVVASALADLTATGDAHLTRYAASLRHLAHSYIWHISSPRYQVDRPA